MRDQLNRKTIDLAIETLIKAKRIEFFAVGNYGLVSEDAQYKFLRFGLPTSSYTEPRLQLMAANGLTPEDVVVVVSSTGRVAELNAAVEKALGRGAKVIAITANQSPLAKRAKVTIDLDHSKDVLTQVPMISRVLYLLVIDIIAVGVAMRTGRHDSLLSLKGGVDALDAEKAPASNRLARMVSHSQE
jgi:glucokinase